MTSSKFCLKNFVIKNIDNINAEFYMITLYGQKKSLHKTSIKSNYQGLWNKTCILFFSKKFVTIWKSSSSRSRKSESKASKLNPRFLTNSWKSKYGTKIVKLFLCFWTFTIFWKIEGVVLRPQTPIFVANSTSSSYD